MPNPNDYSNESEWMGACVPKLVSEGRGQDQAVAACLGMWRNKSIELEHDSMPDEIDKKGLPPLEKTMIGFGGQIKALGNGKIAGYLVRFGGNDLTGEHFSKETDFGEATRLPIFYQHGQDEVIGQRRIGAGDIFPVDEQGLWLEAQLNMRDEYEQMIYQMAADGKLGWSSATASHTMARRQNKDEEGVEITQWFLVEASLTPTPAEPLNSAVLSLAKFVGMKKSAATVKADEQDEPEPDAESTEAQEDQPELAPQGEKKMPEQIVMTPEELKALVADAAAAGVAEGIKAVEPEKSAPDNVLKVIKDEADRPFTSLAEQCLAVKNYEISKGRVTAPRLKFLLHQTEENYAKAASGASEVSPADGGILLDPTLSDQFLAPVHQEGPFSSLVRKLPVSPDSNYGWINGVDETSRATGSRWGGIRGYRLAEAATLTSSAPKFRRINWELKKYAVLVYGTDELLKDKPLFTAVVQQGCREELAFMLNDDILNGTGLAGPQGIMNSGALITVTRTTGSKILGDDISNMWNRLDLRSRANAVFFVGNDSQPQLDNIFAVGSTAVLFPYASVAPGGVRTLYGRPVITTEFNQTLNTTGDIVLADMAQYLLWEASNGIDEAQSIHVQFLTDQTVFRFIYRVDGQSSVYSALTPKNGSTTTSPWVCLTSAT